MTQDDKKSKEIIAQKSENCSISLETSCVRCGASMSPFVWGIKSVDTCGNCGFKHPCCE